MLFVQFFSLPLIERANAAMPSRMLCKVSHPRLKHEGLCLSSTAIQHSVAAVPLWLPRLTHQGRLTSGPYSSSLAE